MTPPLATQALAVAGFVCPLALAVHYRRQRNLARRQHYLAIRVAARHSDRADSAEARLGEFIQLEVA